MANFSLSEIVTIMFVILVVFGPNRLPEMARKAGDLVRKGRQMASQLRREFEGELREVTEPLKEVSDELKGVRKDMGASLSSLTDDMRKARTEVEGKLAETNRDVEEVTANPSDKPQAGEPVDKPADEAVADAADTGDGHEDAEDGA